MCEFCKVDSNEIDPDSIRSFGRFKVGIYAEVPCMNIRYNGDVTRLAINYCPKCGRKLKE